MPVHFFLFANKISRKLKLICEILLLIDKRIFTFFFKEDHNWGVCLLPGLPLRVGKSQKDFHETTIKSVPSCSIFLLQHGSTAHTEYCSCISQQKHWQLWPKLQMSLAAGPIWSAALSRWSFFQFICCLKNESLTAFLSDNFYFRWMDGHSSSEVWRHLFADPARNFKKRPAGVCTSSPSMWKP